MTPQILAIAAYASLGLATLMAGLMLRQPGWQLRDSPVHAVVAVALGLEAALVVWLFESASSPGLSTGTPLIVALACLPLAAVALRQGMTPRGVRKGRLQRLAVTVPALAAVFLWWQRLELLAPTGRDLLDQDLIANAAGIASYGLAGVVLVAFVALFAAFRQKALRRAALPLVGAAALVMPLATSFSGVTVERTCAGQFDDQTAWCRSEDSCLAREEAWRYGRETWVPQGGELASMSWSSARALEVPEVLQPQLYAYRPKGTEHGLYLHGDMLIDGVMSPREAASGLMWVQSGVGSCMEQAQLEPGRYTLSMALESDGSLIEAHLGQDDERLETCVDAVLERARFVSTCSRTDLQLEMVWLGPETDASASL